MAIIKIIEAHTSGPQYWEERYPEHPNWWNGSFVALADCGEIWNLQEDSEYDEDLDDDVEGWRAERYVNPLCKDKKNIWYMQLGCRSTFEYTKFYPTKKELLEALDGAINWQALFLGIEACEPRPLEFGGKMFYPPDYK